MGSEIQTLDKASPSCQFFRWEYEVMRGAIL